MNQPSPTDDSRSEIARELLREDFLGLYQEHLKAGEEFSGRRLRTILAVQAVPLLAIGALLSAARAQGGIELDLVGLPAPVYLVFVAAAILSEVLREMWVRSAFLENTYARALNSFRGKYLELLPKEIRGDWVPWLPTTPALPNLKSGGTALGLLITVVAGLDALYFSLGLLGLARMGVPAVETPTYAVFFAVLLPTFAWSLAIFVTLESRFADDQRRAECRASGKA